MLPSTPNTRIAKERSAPLKKPPASAQTEGLQTPTSAGGALTPRAIDHSRPSHNGSTRTRPPRTSATPYGTGSRVPAKRTRKAPSRPDTRPEIPINGSPEPGFCSTKTPAAAAATAPATQPKIVVPQTPSRK